jgi:hypothetical protein
MTSIPMHHGQSTYLKQIHNIRKLSGTKYFNKSVENNKIH